MSFTQDFLKESASVLSGLDTDAIERLALRLAAVRNNGGRLFLLGVGGSAGSASHATMIFASSAPLRPIAPRIMFPN